MIRPNITEEDIDVRYNSTQPGKRTRLKQVIGLLIGLAMLVGITGFWPSVADAGPNKLPQTVREGLDLFKKGQLTEASERLDVAKAIAPEDQRIVFNQACVKMAQSKWDEAAELFRTAAVADDTQLSIWCNYNLGQIDIKRVRAAIGEKPEELQSEARSDVLTWLAEAQNHYRDCLAIDPNFEDARYNLELLARWTEQIEDAWHEFDRKKQREAMDFAAMLKWLDGQQRALRESTDQFEQISSSPKRRLDLRRTSKKELELSEEAGYLKQKMQAEANNPAPQQATAPVMPSAPAGPGMPQMGAAGSQQPKQSPFAGMDPEQKKQAVEVLGQWIDEAGHQMKTAAEYIHESAIGDAVAAQAGAIEQIDQVDAMLKPYPELVFAAVENQKKRVGETESAVAPKEKTEPASQKDEDKKILTPKDSIDLGIASDQKSGIATEQKPFDPAEAAWNQRFVERWSQIIVGKARQGLKKLPPEPEKKPEEANSLTTISPDGAKDLVPIDDDKMDKVADAGPAEKQLDPKAAAAEQARKQQEALRESMKRAVELGPKVVELTGHAADAIEQNRPKAALPDQAEALKLLEKIAEPLKKPDQNKQNQQKNQDQKNQDQKNKDQQNKDQKQDKKQQDKDKKKQDQDKKDQKDKQKQDQQQSKDQQKQKQAQRKPKDLSKEQAKALIQKVRQRQKEKEKARKALMEYIYQPRQVEKDW
jgi:hypothetical protein